MTHQDLLTAVTTVAVIVGPIFAVLITRWLDDRRARHERRMSVFRDLMRTRRLRLSETHVAALNLVEIEFYGEKDVIAAWITYRDGLSKAPPADLSDPEWRKHWESMDRVLTKLLHAMARALKFEFDQLDIFDGGYTPQGWADNELQTRISQAFVLEILKGQRAIPITPIVPPTPQGPFPPRPELTSDATELDKLTEKQLSKEE